MTIEENSHNEQTELTEAPIETLFTSEDIEQLLQHGISEEEAHRQIAQIRAGSSFPQLIGSASLEFGITTIPPEEREYYLKAWEEFCANPKHKIVKFVPASGAASRMFQELYALFDQEKELQEKESLTPLQREFFERITDFAFYSELSEACLRNEWSPINKLIEGGRFDAIARSLLSEKGMNYGSLPKGLILFHKYPEKQSRTPIAEHLAEAALYTKNRDGKVHLHFTVSPEHLEFFRNHTDRVRRRMEDNFGILCDNTFSIQSPATDTLALDTEGNPFRTQEGKLLLRPGGHGALIKNLNEINADLIFIKNIDNVVPDHLKGTTILYKKLLGGILVALRERIFSYLYLLEKGRVGRSQLEEILDFMYRTLCIDIPQKDLLGEKELIERLIAKLNRPIRVCGMVRNEGEPGGGPYVIKEADGTTSLQILETSQIDRTDPRSLEIWQTSTFFNPVDLVCATTDYKGNHFDLPSFVNERTAFLARKSYEGRELIALERPGLWNGAMDKWNTLFVEVPNDTFTPVKTVNDLLRPCHQGITNYD